MKNYGTNLWHLGKSAEEFGVINQKGLNRKVRLSNAIAQTPLLTRHTMTAYLRLC